MIFKYIAVPFSFPDNEIPVKRFFIDIIGDLSLRETNELREEEEEQITQLIPTIGSKGDHGVPRSSHNFRR